MADLSDRDVEDIIGGVQPPGRDDLATVAELTTWMHASRDLEPAPPMSDGLFSQVGAGVPPTRSSRRAPAHLHRRSGRSAAWLRPFGGQPNGVVGPSLRPALSLAAAAVLLIALLAAVYRGEPQHPSAVASPPDAAAVHGSTGASVTTEATATTSPSTSTSTSTSTTSMSTTATTATTSTATALAPSARRWPAGPASPRSATAPSVGATTSTTERSDATRSADPSASSAEPTDAAGDTVHDDSDSHERRADGDRNHEPGSGAIDTGSNEPAGTLASLLPWSLDDLPWWPFTIKQPAESDAWVEAPAGDGPDDGHQDER